MTGDPTRDTEHTERHFADGEDNDYAAAQQAKDEPETCLRIIPPGQRQATWTDTYCRRPAGHHGDCRPVPQDGDEEET